MATFPIQTSEQRLVLAVASTLLILTVIAMGLRFTAHAVAKKSWTASDHLILAASVVAVSMQAGCIAWVLRAGVGYNHTAAILEEFGPEPIMLISKFMIALDFLWVISLAFTKLSILCLYLQIFPARWMRLSSYGSMGIVIGWALGTILAALLVCRPFAFNWDTSIPGGTCADVQASATANGVLNLITDLIVILLPMGPLAKLQMATFKKITLVSIFGLGLITCVVSGLRIWALAIMDWDDVPVEITKVTIFTSIEPSLAIILASVPAMRPLVQRSPRSQLESTQKATRNTSYTMGPQRNSGNGFERLDDDTSTLWLKPMGVGASVTHETVVGDESSEDGVRIKALDTGDNMGEGGIRVNRSFHMSE